MNNTNFSLNRIRILKTGLAGVQAYIDMSLPENRQYFEHLSEPGTELILKRDYENEHDPFRIEVYSKENILLGAVTRGKNETAARLMDAGLRVIAIANESLPVHDSDMPHESVTSKSLGWDKKSREEYDYTSCNLPYCIYYVEDCVLWNLN